MTAAPSDRALHNASTHLMMVEEFSDKGAGPSRFKEIIEGIEQPTSGELSAANTPLSTSEVAQLHFAGISDNCEWLLKLAPPSEHHDSGFEWSDDDEIVLLRLGDSRDFLPEHEFAHEYQAVDQLIASQVPAQPANTPLRISADVPEDCMRGDATLARALATLQGD